MMAGRSTVLWAAVLGSLVGAGLMLGLEWSGPVVRGQSSMPPLSGKTTSYAIPPYLKSARATATTTFTSIAKGPAVVGCVIINTAGAAGSTITLYNTPGGQAIAATAREVIDATQVGRVFCYGVVFTGGLGWAIASGGAAPDVTISYQSIL